MVPFFIIGATGVAKISINRIAEMLTGVGLTGLIVMYASQQVLGERLDSLARNLETVEKKFDQCNAGIEQMRRDLYSPKFGVNK
jgi:small-conductance mechanosensitive channel